MNTEKKTSPRWGLATLIVIATIGFIVAGLAAVTMFKEATLRESDFTAHSLTGDLQLSTQQIFYHAHQAVVGDALAFDALTTARNQFKHTLRRLKQQSAMPSFASTAISLTTHWQRVEAAVDTLLTYRRSVLLLHDEAVQLDELVIDMQEEYGEVMTILLAYSASVNQLAMVRQQLDRLLRIERYPAEAFSDPEVIVDVIDSLQLDIDMFGIVLLGQLHGRDQATARAAEKNQLLPVVQRISNSDARVHLTSTETLFEQANMLADNMIVRLETVLSDTYSAVEEIDVAVPQLLQAIDQLDDGFTQWAQRSTTILYWALLALIVALVVTVCTLLFVAVLLRRTYRQQQQLVLHKNQHNQQASQQLINALVAVTEGDLTTEAAVTTGLSGAIAVAINVAVDRLGKQIAQLNHTTVQLHSVLQQAQPHWVEICQTQTIAGIALLLKQLTTDMEQLLASSDSVSTMAGDAVADVANIKHCVQPTLAKAMQAQQQLVTHYQRLAQQIKQWRDVSLTMSQTLSPVRGLIDQTHALVLNTIIQVEKSSDNASLAAIMDEAQQLMMQSSNAMEQAETLSTTLHADANETQATIEHLAVQWMQPVAENGASEGFNIASMQQDITASETALNSATTAVQQQAQWLDNHLAALQQQVSSAQRLSDQVGTMRSQAAASASAVTQAATDLTLLVDTLQDQLAGFILPSDNSK